MPLVAEGAADSTVSPPFTVLFIHYARPSTFDPPFDGIDPRPGYHLSVPHVGSKGRRQASNATNISILFCRGFGHNDPSCAGKPAMCESSADPSRLRLDVRFGWLLLA